VSERFARDGEALDWTVTLSNETAIPIEIGDLAVPLEIAERVAPPADVYTQKLIRHAFVAGHGSWVLWQRATASARSS
jgi:hypothetical protein